MQSGRHTWWRQGLSGKSCGRNEVRLETQQRGGVEERREGGRKGGGEREGEGGVRGRRGMRGGREKGIGGEERLV